MPDMMADSAPPPPRARLVAFYLPQFHPIPENDAWWGAGFTEWTNVARTRPLFPGHDQPHLPADLGFYDLRVPEARQAQADLAAAYGVSGFCYYHYWFGGRRVLERPFDDVRRSGEPRLPFCLCWANESWSRRWLGEDLDILLRQTYSAEDDLQHARWLAGAFADERYIRIDGRPVFLIYRPHDLPSPERTTGTIRQEALRAGLPEPYLIGVDAHRPGADFRAQGFDSSLAFAPQLGVLPEAFVERRTLSRLRRNLRIGLRSASLKVYHDTDARALMAQRTRAFPYVPCVYVGWDNTPRRGRKGIVITGTTPDTYGAELSAVLTAVQGPAQVPPGQAPLVFLNAWNEWAEGNHLEPSQRWGHAYLEATRRALDASR